MSKLTDREGNRARQAVSQMFSIATSKEEVVEEVQEEVGPISKELSKEEVGPISKEEVKASEPKKKGRPVVNRETKKRYTMTLLPSIYDQASAIASLQGKSLSEVVGKFLSEYIKTNRD